MPRTIRRILIIRHGESLGNVDRSVHATHADHAIPLSEKGHAQALAAGQFLAGFLAEADGSEGFPPSYIRPRLWVSPYLRTRQTADGIERGIGRVGLLSCTQATRRRFLSSPGSGTGRNTSRCVSSSGACSMGSPMKTFPSCSPTSMHTTRSKRTSRAASGGVALGCRDPSASGIWNMAPRCGETWHRGLGHRHPRGHGSMSCDAVAPSPLRVDREGAQPEELLHPFDHGW